MAKLCSPVIILAGITANYLHDTYPLPPEKIWSVLKREYTRVQMHPDNVKLEAQQPSRISADQPFEIVYREFVEELRHNLRDQEDKPVPVFVFPYDWRQPLEIIEDQLHLFIDEVIERTKLLRHYDAEDYASDPKVNLVGHSMGGLIITGYIAKRGKAHRIAKIATIATPFRGSIEPIVKMTSGLSNITGVITGSREREASRVTPALYYLLPTYLGCLTNSTGEILKDSIFTSAIWQPSILDTLKEYIRLYGLKRQEKSPDRAAALFEALLSAAAVHRTRIESFTLGSAGISASEWMCIVGVDRSTRVKVKIETAAGKNQFTIDDSCTENAWNDDNADHRWNTGDGTVPLRGAIPPFLDPNNVICVRPKDFGWREIEDSAFSTEKLVGFHGSLPNMDLVHRLIVRHFREQRDKRSNTWGLPLPGVTKWDPPIPLDRP